MHEEVILITGANGEIGHGLIHHLASKNKAVVAIDLNPLDEVLQPLVRHWRVGDVLDYSGLEQLFEEYHFSVVFHLASILSTKAEINPELAHKINVEGTLNLLRLSEIQSRRDCDNHVRHQQALLRESRALLQQTLQTACQQRQPQRIAGFPGSAFSWADQR